MPVRQAREAVRPVRRGRTLLALRHRPVVPELRPAQGRHRGVPEGEAVMDLESLARLVRDMRQHQRDYSRTKSQAELAASKDYERRVDQAVKEVLNPPAPGLFDAPACDHAWAPAGNGGYLC